MERFLLLAFLFLKCLRTIKMCFQLSNTFLKHLQYSKTLFVGMSGSEFVTQPGPYISVLGKLMSEIYAGRS